MKIFSCRTVLFWTGFADVFCRITLPKLFLATHTNDLFSHNMEELLVERTPLTTKEMRTGFYGFISSAKSLNLFILFKHLI